MLTRNITPRVKEALQDSRVLLINGARQAGKTTLVKSLIEAGHSAQYVTLDDLTLLQQAKTDPQGFIKNFSSPVIIDEVQRAPEIFLPIKQAVDEAQLPGHFVLTGSTNIFTLPKLADSLAGRMEILHLQPFSQGELAGLQDQFIDRICADKFKLALVEPINREDLFDRILRGGYPEILKRESPRSRKSWFDGYLRTLFERDLRDLSNVRDLHDFPRLLNYLATRSSTILNLSEVSRSVGIQHETLRKYTSLLEALWLIIELPAWSANLGKRMVKTPKIFLNDTGLIAANLGITADRFIREPLLLGQMIETFVVLELMKQQTWSEADVKLYHFRDHNGLEVDVVLEMPNGDIIGIEIKATATPGSEDLSGLRSLQKLAGRRFKRGVLLHGGTTNLAWGEDISMMPISALWQG